MSTDKFTIYFFGDSIFFGQFIPVHKTWVVRLSEYLDREFPGVTCVGNYSVGGNTTRMALERMAYDIQAKRVDVLPIQFGLNDANFWKTDGGVPRTRPQAYKQNLSEMVDRGRAINAKEIILITNHPVPPKEYPEHFTKPYFEQARSYNQLVREVAEEQKVRLIDIEKEIDSEFGDKPSKYDLLLKDGIHLSEAGHDFYLKIVKPVFKEIVWKWVKG